MGQAFCHDRLSSCHEKFGAKMDIQEKVCRDIFYLCRNKQQTWALEIMWRQDFYMSGHNSIGA